MLWRVIQEGVFLFCWVAYTYPTDLRPRGATTEQILLLLVSTEGAYIG